MRTRQDLRNKPETRFEVWYLEVSAANILASGSKAEPSVLTNGPNRTEREPATLRLEQFAERTADGLAPGESAWARQDLNLRHRPHENPTRTTRDRCAKLETETHPQRHTASPGAVSRDPKLEWARQDLNLRPSDYESPALTN